MADASRILKKTGLESLETWASDDLQILEEFGPDIFTTGELKEIAAATDLRILRFERWQRLNLWLGISSMAWLAVAFAAGFSGYIALAGIAVRLFPLSLLVFVLGAFGLRYWLGSLGRLYYLKDVLREKLMAGTSVRHLRTKD